MHRHQIEGNQRLGEKKKINSPFPPSGTLPLHIDYRPQLVKHGCHLQDWIHE